uniref:uncharacterized protein LOC123455297 n=1 Tax=Jaculus jaculus TaxID=51337 RepID=UPI001E1B0C96|nr:uncharacterized protein LOC123455297 [Jaculus jaculus]
MQAYSAGPPRRMQSPDAAESPVSATPSPFIFLYQPRIMGGGGNGSFENPLTLAMTPLREAVSPGATQCARKPEAVPRLKAKGPFISRARRLIGLLFISACCPAGELGRALELQVGVLGAGRGLVPGVEVSGKSASRSSEGAPERAKDRNHVCQRSPPSCSLSLGAWFGGLGRRRLPLRLFLHLHSAFRALEISDPPSCLSQVPGPAFGSGAELDSRLDFFFFHPG